MFAFKKVVAERVYKKIVHGSFVQQAHNGRE